MSDEQKRILERVRKMLALANDAAASEGERENAMRMAHATLAKYNLSLSEAEASGSAPEEARIEGGMVGRDYPWMRTCAHAMAELFFCEYLIARARGGKVVHYFVGRESNTITAREMTSYVISSIDREAKRWSAETYSGSNGWRSFAKGAASRVYVRARKIREEAERAPVTPSTSTALVLASVYALEQQKNKALIAQLYGDSLRQGRATQQRNTSSDAYAAGREFGDRVSLNQQLGSSSSNNRRLK